MKLILLVALFILLAMPTAQALELKSAAFANGQPIPATYTCTGSDHSIPLSWSGLPQGTKSLVLIVDDPEAPGGTWVHWLVWNIPIVTTGLKENVERMAVLSNGTKQGINSFQKVGYNGPCPPRGLHHYYFYLYALDTQLSLSSQATRAQLDAAMRGHILAQTTLMGTARP